LIEFDEYVKYFENKYEYKFISIYESFLCNTIGRGFMSDKCVANIAINEMNLILFI
jgi:hypothetical protein